MTKASDNAFPSILVTEGTEPSAPAAGKQRLYIDSTTHHLMRTNSSGTETDVEGGGSAVVSAHGARVHRASTNFSIGNNTYTAVGFDAEDYDTDTIHDNSTANTKLTIPSISGVTTGLWHITAHGYITGGTVVHYELRLGGSTLIAFGVNNDAAVGSFHISTDYVLSATNYLEVLLKCPTGTASAVFDAGISPYFMVSYLGKVT